MSYHKCGDPYDEDDYDAGSGIIEGYDCQVHERPRHQYGRREYRHDMSSQSQFPVTAPTRISSRRVGHSLECGPSLPTDRFLAAPGQHPELGGHWNMQHSTWSDDRKGNLIEGYMDNPQKYNSEPVVEKSRPDKALLKSYQNSRQSPWSEDCGRDASRSEWAHYQDVYGYRTLIAEAREHEGTGRNDDIRAVSDGNKGAMDNLRQEHTDFQDWASDVEREPGSLGYISWRPKGSY